MAGVFRLMPLMREKRLHLADKPAGYLGTLGVGMAFGAGWTPCIGPVLGAILTYGFSQDTMWAGVGLLTVYSLGLAIPFLVAALALDWFLQAFKRFRRFIPIVEKASGVLLVFLGVLLLTGIVHDPERVAGEVHAGVHSGPDLRRGPQRGFCALGRARPGAPTLGVGAASASPRPSRAFGGVATLVGASRGGEPVVAPASPALLYASRSVSAGSTVAARLAGRSDARAAAARSNTSSPTYVTGSPAVTP